MSKLSLELSLEFVSSAYNGFLFVLIILVLYVLILRYHLEPIGILEEIVTSTDLEILIYYKDFLLIN